MPLLGGGLMEVINPLLWFYQYGEAQKQSEKQRTASLGNLGYDYESGAFTGGGLAGTARQTVRSVKRRTTSGYRQLLQDYRLRESRTMRELEGMGKAERDQLRADAQAAYSNASGDAIGRGFGNSGVGASLRRGVQRQYQAGSAQLEERLRANRIATGMALSGDTLGIQREGFNAEIAADQYGFQTEAALTDAANAIITGQQISYPTGGPFDFSMSRMIARDSRPPEPSFGEQLLGGFGAGLAGGASTRLANFPLPFVGSYSGV